MKVILGKTQCSMLRPPNEGTVVDKTGAAWNIGRTYNGAIVLRRDRVAMTDFVDGGMTLSEFVRWINSQLD